MTRTWLPITGWWPDIHTAFTVTVPPSVGFPLQLGVSVPPTVGFTASAHATAAFTVSVPPSIGESAGSFPFTFPHTFG